MYINRKDAELIIKLLTERVGQLLKEHGPDDSTYREAAKVLAVFESKYVN